MPPVISTIARPEHAPRNKYAPILLALVKTKESGQAVRVELNGMNYDAAQQTLRGIISRDHRGWRIHLRKDGDEAFVAWLVPHAEPSGTGGT